MQYLNLLLCIMIKGTQFQLYTVLDIIRRMASVSVVDRSHVKEFTFHNH